MDSKLDLRKIRNKNQRLLAHELRAAGFKVVVEARLGKRYSVDVALPARKLYIEVFGWNHAYEEKMLNDLAKYSLAEAKGWKTLWWWPSNKYAENERAVKAIVELVRCRSRLTFSSLKAVWSGNYA